MTGTFFLSLQPRNFPCSRPPPAHATTWPMAPPSRAHPHALCAALQQAAAAAAGRCRWLLFSSALQATCSSRPASRTHCQAPPSPALLLPLSSAAAPQAGRPEALHILRNSSAAGFPACYDPYRHKVQDEINYVFATSL